MCHVSDKPVRHEMNPVPHDVAMLFTLRGEDVTKEYKYGTQSHSGHDETLERRHHYPAFVDQKVVCRVHQDNKWKISVPLQHELPKIHKHCFKVQKDREDEDDRTEHSRCGGKADFCVVAAIFLWWR
mmetsp:Transcript_23574/g.62084  ORF Transcript_23574/g.62084 Transcript_23574/m.62084 type:complete len:127 (+) Transcript_23574:814-1194(+)